MHACPVPITPFLKRISELAQRPDALQSVMESVPASVFVISRDYTVLRFNSLLKQDLKRTLGVDIYEGYDFNALQGVGNGERWRATFERAFSGIPVVERWEAILPSQSVVLNISCRPIYTGSKVTEVAVYVKDHTEEIRLAHSYQDSMELAKLALESTDALAFDWDVCSNRIETTNLEGITGYRINEVTPSAEWWISVIAEHDRKRVISEVSEVLGQGDTLEIDYQILDAQGCLKHVHSKASVYRDFDGQALRIVGTTQDITSRKKLEYELINARNMADEMNRLKTAFLANMSHEFRTPLTAILGYSDLLKEELQGFELGNYAEIICRSGKRLLETVNSLIDLARIESNMLDLTYETLDVNSQINLVLEELQPLACQRSLSLRFQAPNEQFIALTDRSSLGSILYNLVGNALKFTDTGGVDISVRESRLGLRKAIAIHVSDTGIGIHDTKKIFTPFMQESHGLSRSHEGSGLGLSITHKLVEALGGGIEVASEVGKGSTFTVTLPILDVRYS